MKKTLIVPLNRIEDTARIFDVTPRAVYSWVEKGLLRTIRTPGGAIRIPQEEIERFLKPTYENGDGK